MGRRLIGRRPTRYGVTGEVLWVRCHRASCVTELSVTELGVTGRRVTGRRVTGRRVTGCRVGMSDDTSGLCQ